MAITAIISAGATIAQGIQALSSGGKEDDRLAANQQAYSAAVSGDTEALAFLLQRSGKNGIAFVSGYGEIGGWATQSAQADAWSKYQAAKAAGAVVDTLGQAVGSSTAQGIAQATGNTIVPGTKGDITVWLLAAGVALFVIARKTR